MSQVLQDLHKLTFVVKESGWSYGLNMALLSLRARIMRKSDQKWEAASGLLTREHVLLDSLDVVSENKKHGFAFIPSSGRMVRVMLGNLPSEFSTFTFVDFGSGEGRVLLLAAMFPFREIIGVEFAKELHAAAVSNISKVVPAESEGRIKPLCMDASQFTIPSNECVLYFYNPFGEQVFEQVLRNIAQSYAENGKKMYVLYQQVAGALETERTQNVDMLRAASFLTERTVTFPSQWDRFLLRSHELHIFETQDS